MNNQTKSQSTRKERKTVWCVIEEHNGRAVDCRVFSKQEDAHKYANKIKEKAVEGYPFNSKDAFVTRNKII